MPTPADETDDDLARRARGGSVLGFEELVRRYQVPLLRFLMTRCRDRHAAEDALQDAFLKMYRSIDRYDPGNSFKTWAFTITHRCLIDAARRRAFAVVQTVEAGSENPSDVDQTDSNRLLWDVARRVLPPQQFTAIWLHYVEDLPANQIAAVTGRSWVWVRTALHRARRTLSSHLQPIAEGVL